MGLAAELIVEIEEDVWPLGDLLGHIEVLTENVLEAGSLAHYLPSFIYIIKSYVDTTLCMLACRCVNLRTSLCKPIDEI